MTIDNLSMFKPERMRRVHFKFTHSGIKSRGKHLWMQKFCKVIRRKSCFQGFTHMNLKDLPAKMPITRNQRIAQKLGLVDINI